MNPIFTAYAALATAIVCEVTGTSLLQRSEQFTRALPTIGMIVCFAASLFFLSLALRAIPLGVAYAIWGGLGIILTSIISVVVFRFTLDVWAIVGIGLIVSGVLVMNLLSNSATH
ncbi:multidrug efflux SMR transporter [Pseudohalocynthiibacter aestuariivivens]|uniref:Multidrug efflux SMR transporter n=1 Tax=Roseovarius pelagicus TaxID=2980108 RepID=A0ABY6DDB4_9RHOB|nr:MULTISPECIES: multidrug efflux SMR transporter [Rhodobacterales]QIE47293.1 multidrug efflux SMR transporter [Pseudohalocynthiibacter aestuariivivens]UXX84147.1 multidrug efflux SMR transporter [Roseovarius pelagicus]